MRQVHWADVQRLPNAIDKVLADKFLLEQEWSHDVLEVFRVSSDAMLLRHFRQFKETSKPVREEIMIELVLR